MTNHKHTARAQKTHIPFTAGNIEEGRRTTNTSYRREALIITVELLILYLCGFDNSIALLGMACMNVFAYTNGRTKDD